MKKIFIFTLVSVLAAALLAACTINVESSGGGSTKPTSPSNTGTPSGNSGNNSNGGNSNTNDENVKINEGSLTMSITVADGWKEAEGESYEMLKEMLGTQEYMYATPMTYAFTYFYLYIMENFMNFNESNFIQDCIESYKYEKSEDYYDYSSVTELTVNGHRAYEYTATGKEEDGIKIRNTIIYKGGYAYRIFAQTQKATWDELEPAFNAMRDSFTLK